MGRSGPHPFVVAHGPESDLLKGLGTHSLDFLAIRSLGHLGYDELTPEERHQLDQYERSHSLKCVARTYLQLLRERASLRDFLAAGSHFPPAIPSTTTT